MEDMFANISSISLIVILQVSIHNRELFIIYLQIQTSKTALHSKEIHILN